MKKISKTKLKFNTRTVYTYANSQQNDQRGFETTTTTTITGFITPQKQ